MPISLFTAIDFVFILGINIMSKWTCKRCTFINESDSFCCQVCENVKIEEPEKLENSCRYRSKPMSSYTYKKGSLPSICILKFNVEIVNISISI